MFGIALDLKKVLFVNILSAPKSLIVGLIAQWIALPFFTYLLILVLNPQPSIALGMILVSVCPGGNISNFFSALAKANVELSIVMTCISSVLAILLTPLLLTFYGNLYAPTAEIMTTVSLDWWEVTRTILLIIVIPIILGQLFVRRFPSFADKIKGFLRLTSMLLFLLIVIGAFASNYDYFLAYIRLVFVFVLLHNLIAILSGLGLGKVMKLGTTDIKSLSIEVGIQNSGLGLLLIFSFFSGLGGMAIVAAWWGIWHIVTGVILSFIWNKV
jgi:BASS family bile acid:Na+ symporter